MPDGDRRLLRVLLFAVDDFLSEYIETANADTTQLIDGRLGPTAAVAFRIRKQVEKLTPRESVIIEERGLSTPPKTVAVVAASFGVSSTRVREIQAGSERRIQTACGNELQFTATAMNEAVRHTAEESAIDCRIDVLLPNDLGRRADHIKRFHRQLLLDELGVTLDQGMYVDKQAFTLCVKGRRRRERATALVGRGHTRGNARARGNLPVAPGSGRSSASSSRSRVGSQNASPPRAVNGVTNCLRDARPRETFHTCVVGYATSLEVTRCRSSLCSLPGRPGVRS